MIRTLGIVGAGPMGAGIAEVSAVAGIEVLLVDRDLEIAQGARDGIGAALERAVKKGRMTASEAATALGRITVSEVAGLACADLIVEAIIEKPEPKLALFRSLKEIAPRAIIATNTSSLSVSELAAGSGCARLAGLHFFNPVTRMRLVEVIADEPEAAQLAAFARAIGKTPVRAKDSPGFIVNRCARPFYHEAHRMLEAGLADAAQIDACLRSALGVPLGPFELIDLVGLDINAAASRQTWEAFDRAVRFAPSARLEELVAQGHLGRKTGRGFHRYPLTPAPETQSASHAELLLALQELAPVRVTDGRTAAQHGDGPMALIDIALVLPRRDLAQVAFAPHQLDAETVDALTGRAAALGHMLVPVPDTPGLIALRMAAQLVNEARFAIAEGVASLADIDTAMKLGLNFTLGPGDLLAACGQALDATLAALHEAHPEGAYLPAPKEVS